MTDGGRNILFVTWDGPQVRYLEGLFLPIFEALRPFGNRFAVLQFTWGADNGQTAACAAAGIPYRRVEVDRRSGPLGPFLTGFQGGQAIDRCVEEWSIDLLMPRSILPALATFRSASRRALPILFDSDGLPADERVDHGNLSRFGPTYRLLRGIETRMVRRADHVLTRTAEGSAILAARAGIRQPQPHFTVVPNPRPSTPLPAIPHVADPAAPRLVYAGSFGPQYRPAEMFALAKSVRAMRAGATLQIFTGDPAAARHAMEHAGLVDADWISVEQLSPPELAKRLPRFDAGLALRADSPSMRAVAPIKIGDYLMAGLPIIGSGSVGDVTKLVEAGVMFDVDRKGPTSDLALWLDDAGAAERQDRRRRARALGKELYSLERATRTYDGAINRALAGKDRP